MPAGAPVAGSVRSSGLGVLVLVVATTLGACSSNSRGQASPTTSASTTTSPSTTTTLPSSTASASSATSSVGSSGLSASLNAQPSSGPAGTNVSFTIEASESQPTAPLSYQIDYGDGTNDSSGSPPACTTSQSPSSDTWHLRHTYTRAGTFAVELTVTAERSGCTTHNQVSAEVTITIG
jgi:hypothetical protein